MHILSEHDVTGAAARELRKAAGLSQEQFWSRVGVSQASGCRYERQTAEIPPPVRILIAAVHVASLNLDASTPQALQRLKALGAMQLGHAKLTEAAQLLSPN
jgi:transcriptional regulator with XRE-family HTH domain